MRLPALLHRRPLSTFLRRAFSSSALAPSSKAVPSAFPDLRDDRLAALLRTTQKPVGGEDPDAFVDAYHPERLEWFGDTLLKLVVMETLLQLAPIQRLKLGGALKAPNLAELTKETSRLGTIDMNAKLTTEFQLTPGSLSVRDQWEAAIAALYFSNGYKALVDFLVPLVKREFFAHWPALKELYELPEAKRIKPKLSIRGVIAPSTPSSVVSASPAVQAVPKPLPPPKPSLPSSAGAWSKDLTKKQVAKIEKLSLSFPTLEAAERDLFPSLQAKGSTFSFRQVGKRKVALRLPGYPMISAMGGKKTSEMTALVRTAVAMGAIKIKKP